MSSHDIGWRVKIGVGVSALVVIAVFGCSSAPGQTAATCSAGETMCNKECIDTFNDQRSRQLRLMRRRVQTGRGV